MVNTLLRFVYKKKFYIIILRALEKKISIADDYNKRQKEINQKAYDNMRIKEAKRIADM